MFLRFEINTTHSHRLVLNHLQLHMHSSRPHLCSGFRNNDLVTVQCSNTCFYGMENQFDVVLHVFQVNNN
jgi:hypothetical protein